MLSSVRRPQPLVTGISPKEGPPGTKVTIRGEHLGVDAKDLIGLRICGVDCLLSAEWKSPSKIIARTGQAKGKGEVIVVTRSGGVGSCTVVFRGFIVQIGPLQESAVWIDESQTVSTILGRSQATSPMLGAEHDDPLGISDESNESRFPEEELNEMFPEGSGSTTSENFEPAWYLLENHHGTSFDDLKAGLAYLKRKSSQRNEGPLAFVKTNLTTFMDCQDKLAEMHTMMESDHNGKPGSITDDLEKVLMSANESADTLFQGVLRRKDRADATRNALSVLHRFKFLFNLPCSIDRNIKAGDFDLVITDYTRAKSLFGDTDVQIFQKVYHEVENRIKSFRSMLHQKLLDLPSTVEEQKKFIRYLVYLQADGDPAWECLLNQQKWLLNLLNNCKEEHLAKEKAGGQVEREGSPASPKVNPPQAAQDVGTKTGSKAPQKVLFVEDLTRILTTSFPDFWRLGQAYFTGKLLRQLTMELGLGSKPSRRVADLGRVVLTGLAGEKPQKIDPAKHTQFKQMVLGVITSFSSLLRAAFLPDSLEGVPKKQRERLGLWPDHTKDSPIAWLPICVRYVRACVVSLSKLDLSSDCLEILQELAFDMRTNCMSTLLKQAILDIEHLHTRERWAVDFDDESGGTTMLPALFENIVTETLQHLQEVMQARAGENEIFSQRPIQKEAVDLCTHLLQAFASTLEQLAVIGNVERKTKRCLMMQFQGGTVQSGAARVCTHDGWKVRQPLPSTVQSEVSYSARCVQSRRGDKMPSLDKRLMVMLSNCKHTQEQILPRLAESLERHGYPETQEILKAAQWSYANVDDKLFDNYIEEKANPVVGALEQNMYMGHFNWNDCLKPSGVRSYIKEAVMSMIEVHAEVYSISPHFVPRCMCKIVEAVADEIGRLLQCVPEFSANGALQACLEVQALEMAVASYKTEDAVETFKEALEALPKSTSPDDKKLIEDLLNRFRTQMRFQLTCFQTDQSNLPT